MTDKEIVALAKESGFSASSAWNWILHLQAFAELVATREHERCAKVCEAIGLQIHGAGREDGEAYDCADAIRNLQ